MKTNSEKPRICIVLPNINYLPYSPYVLSTLPIIPYLEEEFDVTLAFRKVLETQGLDYNYLTILEPSKISDRENQNKDGYFTPTDYIKTWKYLKKLDNFAQKHAGDFDLVIEKEWPLLGAVSQAFSRYKVPTITIVEAEFKFKSYWQGNPIKQLVKKIASFGFQQLRPHVRKKWLQRANSIIVETQQMGDFLVEHGYANTDTPIYPISNGVNPSVFFPQERNLCRDKLGINKDSLIITYVGSLNRFIQEPGPIIEALGREKPKNVILHVVGDGSKRKELEDIAIKFDSTVIFHGRLQQKEAALYMGAANVCIAPYNKDLFSEGKFTCASLKVCEYLACGRPVLTIPCERMEHLLNGSSYGFLVENRVDEYRQFFRHLPSIDDFYKIEASILSDMHNSILRDKSIVLTWGDIAQMYKKAIAETL